MSKSQDKGILLLSMEANGQVWKEVNAVCNVMKENCHISCGLWSFYSSVENY